MGKALINRRNLVFVGITVLALIAIILLPIHPILNPFFDEDTARYLRNGLIALIAILFTLFGAAKSGVLREGGFIGGNTSNYWMLLIPLIFPGLLMLGNISGCKGFLYTGGWFFMSSITMIRAVMEEVVFRGLIQGFLRKYNPGASPYKIVAFTAAVFALIHYTAIAKLHPFEVTYQVIAAFCIGYLLGAVQYRVNNVWLMGLSHGLLNIFSRNCSPEPASTENITFMEHLTGWGGVLLAFSPALLLGWLLIRTGRKQKRS